MPLLGQLMLAGGQQHAGERHWMLQLLLAGLRSAEDAALYRRKHVFELAMSLHDSYGGFAGWVGAAGGRAGWQAVYLSRETGLPLLAGPISALQSIHRCLPAPLWLPACLLPAVADPGSSVVLAAHQLGIRVVPLVGPASLLLALAASGLNGQNFAFVGYLPQDSAARLHRIRELETLATKTGQTQLFIETPYRNKALWEALLKSLQPHTRLARASGLTLPTMDVQCRAVKDWRQSDAIGDAPTVFAIGK